jgi:exosome complex component RRP46
VKLQNLDIDKASIEVYYRPKAGLSSVTDRLKEKIIRNTCNSALLATLHPRTAVSIQIQEMEDRGGVHKLLSFIPSYSPQFFISNFS